MPFFSQKFSSASNMEINEQSQPQLEDSNTSQTEQSTTSLKQENQESVLHESFPNNGHRLPDQDNPNPTQEVKDETLNEDLVDQEFFDNLPPGHRFNPTDAELIIHYLKPKIENKRLPRNQIRHVNLYQYSPDEITARYRELTESERYFFTPRDRKYRNGNRPNRAAGSGYWKATGADKPIIFNEDEIGFRKALVFYEGKPPKGVKTSWIMHEYRVKEAVPRKKRSEIDMRLDDYILCRIYKKSDKLFKRQRAEVQNQDFQEDKDLSTSKEIDGSRTAGYKNQFMNAYGDFQFSHVMDTPIPLESIHSQQPVMNKRMRNHLNQDFQEDQDLSTSKENDGSCTASYRNEFMNGDLQFYNMMDAPIPLQSFHSQQPVMNNRVRNHLAPSINFPPLAYNSAENISGYFKDENFWNLTENRLGMKTSQVQFDFPDTEVDNIFTPILSVPSQVNPSLPKRN